MWNKTICRKKIKEIYYSMKNKKYSTIEDMIVKVQILKGETKLNFHQVFSSYYDEMNYLRQSGKFHFEDDPNSKSVESIAMIMQEALLIMKFIPTNDLYYTIILNLSDGGE